MRKLAQELLIIFVQQKMSRATSGRSAGEPETVPKEALAPSKTNSPPSTQRYNLASQFQSTLFREQRE